MRIAFVTGSLDHGGTESQVVRLAAELAARGHTPRIFVMHAGGALEPRAAASGIEVVNWQFEGFIRRRPVATARALWRGISSLHAFHPDVVHALLPTAYLVAMPMAFLLRVPVRVASRRSTLDTHPLPGHRPQRHRLSNRCATAVVANSRLVARATVERERVDPDRVSVIENGVDLPVAKADPGHEPATGIVVAQLRAEKGHEDLLRALALLDPRPVVHLVGDGPERSRLEALSQELGLERCVEFDGYVADPRQRLADAQFAVLPSHAEGLPNAVLEAMAAGLPTIATDVGGVTEVISDGVDGCVVPSSDPVALAKAIQRLCDDPALRERLGSAARGRIEEFSWERVVDRHLALYRAGRAPAAATREQV